MPVLDKIKTQIYQNIKFTLLENNKYCTNHRRKKVKSKQFMLLMVVQMQTYDSQNPILININIYHISQIKNSLLLSVSKEKI